MEAARTNLRLLNPDAVVDDDSPQSYADALVALHDERARNERLETENGHLGEALKREVVEHRKTKAKLHKDLRLHKDYAKVQQLWDEVWRPAHPRARDHPPEDWLRMALDRLKDFDEADLARALHGAINNPAVVEGVVYDGWDNALRSSGHVRRSMARADAEEKKAHRDLDARPEVAALMRELGVSRLGDLAARCGNCGGLMVAHGVQVCGDPDDSDWRAEDWWRRKTAELERRPGRCVGCRGPVTADQWSGFLVAWADLAEGGKGYVHHRCLEAKAT